jgi:hypothetical protein
MAGATKQGKIPEGSHDENIDLSAGFVPKSTHAAGEPASEELTPDSFMAQHSNDIDPSATEPEKFDFVPEEPVARTGSEPQPIEKPAEITWHWAARADMTALQLLHFQAELAAGRGMYLPELSFPGAIAVARRADKIVGGFVVEESVVATPIGIDPEVLEASEVVISRVVAQARKDGTRFLHVTLPARLAVTLDGALQKVGFKLVDGIQYRLDTGIEAEEQDSTRRN